jgi:hypothetical protein
MFSCWISHNHVSDSVPLLQHFLTLSHPFRGPPLGGTLDPAYPVVKQMLTKSGYLSQFLNFNTHNHCNARDAKDTKRSNIILQGVARQILQKAGVRLWWVKLPPSLPLPAVFVGVDVFHAPRVSFYRLMDTALDCLCCLPCDRFVFRSMIL